jgi:uncharacterized protein YeaO (DUF488 family)
MASKLEIGHATASMSCGQRMTCPCDNKWACQVGKRIHARWEKSGMPGKGLEHASWKGGGVLVETMKEQACHQTVREHASFCERYTLKLRKSRSAGSKRTYELVGKMHVNTVKVVRHHFRRHASGVPEQFLSDNFFKCSFLLNFLEQKTWAHMFSSLAQCTWALPT